MIEQDTVEGLRNKRGPSKVDAISPQFFNTNEKRNFFRFSVDPRAAFG